MQRRIDYFVLIGSLLLLILPKLPGDTPLPPPEFLRVASMDFKFVAESDPKSNETIVYRENRGPDREVLWKFPRWFRAFQISYDGNVIVGGD